MKNKNLILLLLALILFCYAFVIGIALDNIAATTVQNLLDFFADGTSNNELCYRCGRMEQCMKERNQKCF